MNCKFHPETQSVAFCVTCGSALCGACRREVEGSLYCETCLEYLIRGRSVGSRRQTGAASGGGDNPGLAFALGLIPGVGAIYNGDFFKAAAHIVIFGLLIAIADSSRAFEGLFTLFVVGFLFYMPFEAYYTSKKRRLKADGIDLETPIDRFHERIGSIANRELWGGVGLVALGVLFLADSLRIFSLDSILRLWPIVMIVNGGLLLHRHYSDTVGAGRAEARHRPGAGTGWKREEASAESEGSERRADAEGPEADGKRQPKTRLKRI
jgi:hypothetical protein